jgi:hypothetical protein
MVYMIYFIFLLSIDFSIFSPQILRRIAHNVPAVGDIFPALVFAQQRPGLQKCGWRLAWE